VGRRLQTGDADPDSTWSTIVGVVGDVKYQGLDAPEYPTLYVPFHDEGWNPWFVRSMSLVLKTKLPPSSGLAEVRAQVGRLDPNVPVPAVRTMEELLTGSVATPRFRTVLLGAFAGLALILAAIGVYGVLAYSVARRTHEMGVRLALGARQADVLQHVLGQGARLIVPGVVAGIAASLALTRVAASLLFGVSASDPFTFVAVALLLVLVALAASYVPARRAAAVDPLVALRYE
jgi:putative ABC transport system permease protein